MQVVYTNCAGLDVHKRSVVGCILNSDPNQPTAAPKKQLKTFGTMVEDILALGDWLMSNGCTQVVMESTASYWKPVYNLLETQFELIE